MTYRMILIATGILTALASMAWAGQGGEGASISAIMREAREPAAQGEIVIGEATVSEGQKADQAEPESRGD